MKRNIWGVIRGIFTSHVRKGKKKRLFTIGINVNLKKREGF